MTQEHQWYQDETTGKLDMSRLLEAFQQFYRENIESWIEHYQYKEAGPQLLLQAFLQRVINGGGKIDREYGLGKGRIDLFVRFQYPGGTQRIVLELKLRKGTREKTIEKAIPQITKYMDRCGTSDGHLVIFDPSDATWDEKIFHEEYNHDGIGFHIWGM